MADEIARLLNINSSDKQKLNEQLQDYLGESDAGSDSESESDTNGNAISEDDDDDVEQDTFDMAATDCDLALNRAAKCSETLAGDDEMELKKAMEFR